MGVKIVNRCDMVTKERPEIDCFSSIVIASVAEIL